MNEKVAARGYNKESGPVGERSAVPGRRITLRSYRKLAVAAVKGLKGILRCELRWYHGPLVLKDRRLYF